MSATTRLLDRREVLAAAAGAAAVACLPYASLATPSLGAPERAAPLADWSIDDQWGVVPRWDAIPCVPQHGGDARLALAHPADVGYLAQRARAAESRRLSLGIGEAQRDRWLVRYLAR